jgi:hypothetical protein
MGGGQSRKSTANVVVNTPRPKHKNGVQLAGAGGATGVSSGEAASTPCKTFYVDKPNGAIRKVTAGMSVYAQKSGRSAEVINETLGRIGFVPSRIATVMLQEGRNVQWSGNVLEVDIDRLSIKVTLCPSQ